MTLPSFAGSGRDVADPWYTDDFDSTYNDLEKGLNKLIDSLTKKNND